MKEKEMATNEVVGELTEKEIVAGAYNVMKKSLLEKLQNEESDSMLEILGLNKAEFKSKMTGDFIHSVVVSTSSYTEMWKMILEKSDSIEEFVMTMHIVYQTREDINEFLAGIKDPMQQLIEVLKRKMER